MKLLIVLLALAALLWLLLGGRSRGSRGTGDRAAPPTQAPPPATEGMVVCAHCMVHLPASESVRADALHYCSNDHRDAGPHKSAR